MDLLDLIFPKSCLSCHQSGSYICAKCLSKVEFASPVCPSCKRFSPNGVTHPGCKSESYLDGALAVWRYEGVIRKALLKLKYNFVSDIANDLSQKASIKILSNSKLLQSSVFIPIPLHKSRSKWRGFNQSKELAKGLSKQLFVPVEEKILIRISAGIPQARLNRDSRLRNMRGKYAVNVSREALAKWDRIILVDDVWTTGSTFQEAARVLKQAGAKEVWGLSVAR
jgi:ComF family protein